MHGARLQPRQAELAQPGAYRTLMHLDRPAAGYLCPQIGAAPADDLVQSRIRASDHQRTQFRLLRLGQ